MPNAVLNREQLVNEVLSASGKTTADDIEVVVENLLEQEITLKMLADPDGGVPDHFLKARSKRAFALCVSSSLVLAPEVERRWDTGGLTGIADGRSKVSANKDGSAPCETRPSACSLPRATTPLDCGQYQLAVT